MPRNLREFLLFCSWLAIAAVDSLASLQFSGKFSPESLKGSYAEFHGWPMGLKSKLQLYFKTASTKPALLLYQDAHGQENSNRNAKNDFIEVSLLQNGNVRLHVSAHKCSNEEGTVKNNFTDGLWHKLVISKPRRSKLILSVDNVTASAISCEVVPRLSTPTGKAKRPLFIGGIPYLDSKGNLTFEKWSQIGLLSKVSELNRWFHGCIALLRYNSADDKPLENATLVASFDVKENCSGETCAQKLHQCQHGGRCVDLVIKTECNCNGTGFYGHYCERPANLNSTSAINGSSLQPTGQTDFKPDSNSEKGDNSGEGKNINSSTAREKKDPRSSSSLLYLSRGWCILILLANLLNSFAS